MSVRAKNGGKQLRISDGLVGEEGQVAGLDSNGTYWIGTRDTLSVIRLDVWASIGVETAIPVEIGN